MMGKWWVNCLFVSLRKKLNITNFNVCAYVRIHLIIAECNLLYDYLNDVLYVFSVGSFIK